MHRYVVPASVKDRVVSRMGRLLAHDKIEAGRTALVVVNMQNYFCAQGFPAEVPLSREIVPNINRMAKTVRAALCVDPDHGCRRARALAQLPDAHADAASAASAARWARRGIGRFQVVPGARGAAGRHTGQEDQLQRLHAWLIGHRRAAQSPRHRHGADHRHGDECVLRVDGATRCCSTTRSSCCRTATRH